MDYKKLLKKNGYCVVSQALPVDLCIMVREAIDGYFRLNGMTYNLGKTSNNSIGLVPGVLDLYTANPVTEKLFELIGTDIAFGYHSDAAVNTVTDWHRDVRGETWKTEHNYDIYKVAFYLQDHIDDDNALAVVPGSHKEKNTIDRKYCDQASVRLHPKLGDMVVFDQRIVHNGAKSNRLMRQALKVLPNNVGSSLSNFLFSRHQNRVFVQCSFGVPNKCLSEHIKIVKERETLAGFSTFIDQSKYEELESSGYNMNFGKDIYMG